MAKKRIKSLIFDEVDEYDIVEQKKRKLNKDGYELERFSRELLKLFSPSKKKKTDFYSRRYYKNDTVNIRPENLYKQRCTVKFSYENDKKLHLNFLKKYMPQLNKSEVIDKPVLFSRNSDSVSDEEIENYVATMSKKFYRCIVSPDAQDIPVELLVKNLMKKIEAATGYKLKWFAAKHTDTAHVHAHVLINGYDETGKEVYLPREFISNTVRSFARDVCTDIKGFRTEEEIEQQKKADPHVRRFCKLDDEISRFESAVDKKRYSEEIEKVPSLKYFETVVTAQNDMMLERLFTLMNMGLAYKVKTSKKKFLLEKDWKEKLKTLGRYNAFIDARNNLKYADMMSLNEYKPSDGMISGEITRVYKINFEGSWTNAIVIENKDMKKAWFIPLSAKNAPDTKLLSKKATWQLPKSKKGKQNMLEYLRVME